MTERTARPEIGGQEVDFQPSEMMTAGAEVAETVMNHLEDVVDMIGMIEGTTVAMVLVETAGEADMTAETTATDVMIAGGMVAIVVMTAGMTGVADTTDVMTAGAMTAVITMTDVMVGMTVEVTAEATIAEAVVIDMTVGLKTGGHQIVMMVLEKGQNCS